MINQDFLNNVFFKYYTNQQSVRGVGENPFNKLYERKEVINRNNIKYKHDFIIMKFNNIFEYNYCAEIGYLYDNINYSINSITALKNYIESVPEKIKLVIDEYKLLNHIIDIDINEEIDALNEIAKTILKDSKTIQIIAEIENTKEGLLLIKNNMDNFKKEKEPDNNEITQLKETYKKVEKSIVQIVDLDFINKQLDIAINYNHIIFKKARSLGYSICEADVFSDNQTQQNNENYKEIEIVKSKYESMFIFKDNSLLFKNKDGGYTDVTDNQHLMHIQDEIKIDIIKYEFRKNPSLLKSMITIIKRTSSNHDQIIKIIKKYQENSNILKNYNFDILESFAEIKGDCNYKELEQIDDEIHKSIRQHKIKLFAYSIASKKYHKLYNQETMILMEHIHDLELDPEVLQNEIGKKLAVYKDSDEFNETLNKFYTYFTDLSKSKILENSKSTNTKIITDENNMIILQIDNFNQSKLFGSSSWCITREESYYKKYTQNNKKQYFIYNFDKKLTDKASLIGVTLNGKQLHVAHYKDDTLLKDNDDFLKKCIEIIDEKA